MIVQLSEKNQFLGFRLVWLLKNAMDLNSFAQYWELTKEYIDLLDTRDFISQLMIERLMKAFDIKMYSLANQN